MSFIALQRFIKLELPITKQAQIWDECSFWRHFERKIRKGIPLVKEIEWPIEALSQPVLFYLYFSVINHKKNETKDQTKKEYYFFQSHLSYTEEIKTQ